MDEKFQNELDPADVCGAARAHHARASKRWPEMSELASVVFLNPRTCGIYKDGGIRFKTDPGTGLRTTEIDNELSDQVTAYLQNELPAGAATVGMQEVFTRQVLVPTYYDQRYDDGIKRLLRENGLKGIKIGELIETKQIMVRGGHGSRIK